MTAGDLALVIGVVLTILGFAALVLVLYRVLVALRDIRGTVDGLAVQISPLLADLRSSVDEAKASVDEARDDLDRFDRVLGSAEAISARLEGTSRVTRAAFSAPVIKTVALASGTQQASRRLRRRERKERRER